MRQKQGQKQRKAAAKTTTKPFHFHHKTLACHQLIRNNRSPSKKRHSHSNANSQRSCPRHPAGRQKYLETSMRACTEKLRSETSPKVCPSCTKSSQSSLEHPAGRQRFAEVSIATVRQPGAVSVPGTLNVFIPSDDNHNCSDHDSRQAVEQGTHELLIQADLVVPIRALFVSPDNDEEASSDDPLAIGNDTEEADEDKPRWGSKRRSKFFILLVAVAVVGLIVLAVALAWGKRSSDHNGEEAKNIKNGDENQAQDTAQDFGYPCFKSTNEVMLAQIGDTINNRLAGRYFICPNTTIKIGVPKNLGGLDLKFIDGERSLSPVASNIILQCGADGSSKNNCTIKDGWAHVLIVSPLPFMRMQHDFLGGWMNPVNGKNLSDKEIAFMETHDWRVDNVTIQGFTFTGILEWAGSFWGASVVMSQPGDVTFVDCRWRDIVSDGVVVYVGGDYMQQMVNDSLSDMSARLILKHCTFENVMHDLSFLFADSQIMIVEDSTFSDFVVSRVAEESCFWKTANEKPVFFPTGCAFLMTCYYGAKCSMKNSCVERIGTKGAGLIFSDNAEISFQSNFADTVTQQENKCLLILADHVSESDPDRVPDYFCRLMRMSSILHNASPPNK